MKRLASIALLVVLAAAFFAALWRLFDLRFSTGDVYPPASTFRADPLGARAFHDSLTLLPDRGVRRLLEPVRRVGNGADTTLFLLGVSPDNDGWLDRRTARELDDFLVQGGRLVVTFTDLSEPLDKAYFSATNRIVRVNSSTNFVEDPGRLILAGHFGFELGAVQPMRDSNGVAQAVSAEVTTNGPATLPRELAWHSTLRLTQFSGAGWRVFYAHEGDAVLAARPVGKGLLIVATDSWFHSNEALRSDRATPLLAWLVGPNRRIIFDETHLGTELAPGIMTLARRYRLHGLSAGLLLLAALYVWRQTTSLVPRLAPTEDSEDVVTARDSATGFVNLLRRSVAPADVVALCFTGWRKSVGVLRPDLSRKLADMQDVINLEAARPPKERTPVATYRKLTKILNQR
jgi:hypothetical protein